MNNNISADQGIIISQFKEMYESNNRVLTNITQMVNGNTNLSNETIDILVNNLINSNNEIMTNIINLLNGNNRQQNRNRQRTNNRYNNNFINDYINDPIYNYPNSRAATDTRLSNLIYSFLEPIEIFPTTSQIESATRVVRFGDIINPLNTACPSSLENFNENDQVLIIRHCDHIFSNPGLISWFRTNCRCPVCRYDIRNHVSNHPNTVSNLSNNVEVSSNVLSSSLPNRERITRNNSSNILVDLIFGNLLNVRNVTDISGNNLSNNNLSNNNNSTSDVSDNLLRLFFTSQ